VSETPLGRRWRRLDDHTFSFKREEGKEEEEGKEISMKRRNKSKGRGGGGGMTGGR